MAAAAAEPTGDGAKSGSVPQVTMDSADPTLLSTSMLSEVTGFAESDIKQEVESMSGAGGLSGEMRRYKVSKKGDSADPLTFVLKTTHTGRESGSKALGLMREAQFYEFMTQGSGLDFTIPKVLAVSYDVDAGTKHILMEDLSSCVQSGQLFGPGSPLNWGKDLDAAAAKCKGITPMRVAGAAFINAARLHGKYWMDAKLTDTKWLRGARWPLGEGKEAWEASQASVVGAWKKHKEDVLSKGEQGWWSPEIVALFDASVSKVSWESHCDRYKKNPWTLVHGDFHPANMMIRTEGDGAEDAAAEADAGGAGSEAAATADAVLEQARADAHRVVMLDFEVVGLGSGPQDLGQYMISHVEPDLRRKHEDALLGAYHAELVAHGVDGKAFTLEDCKREYAFGAAERWVWLLGYMTGMCPEPVNRFLHDQVLAFVKDHGVTPESIGQPRS